MPDHPTPDPLKAMEQIFAKRKDLKIIVEYQQRLFVSLQELNKNHRTIYEHVRNLTTAHNKVQDDTTQLVALRHETKDILRSLTDAHRQTRNEVQRALDAIQYVQQELSKIAQLEHRIEQLEQGKTKPYTPQTAHN